MAVTRPVTPENMSLCRDRFSLVAIAILKHTNTKELTHYIIWWSLYQPYSFIGQLIRAVVENNKCFFINHRV